MVTGASTVLLVVWDTDRAEAVGAESASVRERDRADRFGMEVACALRGAPGRLERSAAEGREVEAEAVGLREDAPRTDSRAWDESSERRFFRSGTAMASFLKGMMYSGSPSSATWTSVGVENRPPVD